MKPWLFTFVAIAMCTNHSSHLKADIPVPQIAAKEIKFIVELDEKSKGPKLIVPQNLANPRVRPQPGANPPTVGAPPPEETEQAQIDIQGDSIALEQLDQPREYKTLVMGIALSLAFATGGYWLIRHNHKTTLGMLLFAIASLSFGGTTYVWGNAGPPKIVKVVLPVAFDGKITFEQPRNGDAIRLVLDKETYDKIKAKPKNPE